MLWNAYYSNESSSNNNNVDRNNEIVWDSDNHHPDITLINPTTILLNENNEFNGYGTGKYEFNKNTGTYTWELLMKNLQNRSILSGVAQIKDLDPQNDRVYECTYSSSTIGYKTTNSNSFTSFTKKVPSSIEIVIMRFELDTAIDELIISLYNLDGTKEFHTLTISEIPFPCHMFISLTTENNIVEIINFDNLQI
eukprot:TRINITY_DN464_c0_g5_i1.p1 TRINITY_DN464_c0_g5~~TRINITY_DN464_c0_g5_i1.p1  ORF type:complete len:195 (+),score=36.17 TRINITY_DN464_c0_g5_i1:97-681(+)